MTVSHPPQLEKDVVRDPDDSVMVIEEDGDFVIPGSPEKEIRCATLDDAAAEAETILRMWEEEDRHNS